MLIHAPALVGALDTLFCVPGGGEQRKTLFCTLMEQWGAGHCIADSMAIICMGLLFRYMAK